MPTDPLNLLYDNFKDFKKDIQKQQQMLYEHNNKLFEKVEKKISDLKLEIENEIKPELGQLSFKIKIVCGVLTFLALTLSKTAIDLIKKYLF